MLADAPGRPLRFLVTPGQTGEITAAPALLDRQEGGAVLAGKTYDSNVFRRNGLVAVIPSSRSRRVV